MRRSRRDQRSRGERSHRRSKRKRLLRIESAIEEGRNHGMERFMEERAIMTMMYGAEAARRVLPFPEDWEVGG